MLKEQTKSSIFIVFTALLIAISSVGVSISTYARLNETINNNHIVTNRLQQVLQNSIKKNSDTISYLSNKNDKTVKQLESKPTNSTAIINHINAQNKVIDKILEHYQSLQNQISELKVQATRNNELYSNSSPTTNSNESTVQVSAQKPITMEYLEQEMESSKQNEEKLYQKTETTFQSQSQDGLWAAETNLLIQNSLEKIRTEPQFNDMGVNNIDCRQSMCKVELSHRDSQQLENFDLMFLLEVSGNQSITATTINKPLADGGINSTYYLSTN